MWAALMFLVGVAALLVSILVGRNLVEGPHGTAIRATKTTTTSEKSLTDSSPAQERTNDGPRAWLDAFLRNVPVDGSKLLICTAHCASTRYIEAQVEALKKFCTVPYTQIVLNDVNPTTDAKKHDAIQKFCRERGIYTFTFPEELHSDRTILFPGTLEPRTNAPSSRCGDGVQLFFQIFRKHGGTCMILDSDCCPVRPFTPEDILQGKSYAAIQQQRVRDDGYVVDYLWHTVMAFDMKKFEHPEWMNADLGLFEGVTTDTLGGWHTYYLKTNRSNMPRFVGLEVGEPIAVDFPFLKDMIEKYSKVEYFDRRFIHFHNASGWDPKTPREHEVRSQDWLDAVRLVIAAAQ